MPNYLNMNDSPAPEDSDAGPNTTLPLPAEPPYPTSPHPCFLCFPYNLIKVLALFTVYL